jgi:hypothetical protein
LKSEDQDRADSLEPADPQVEGGWLAEIERRATELESGAVQGVSWADLREKLMRGRRGP